MIVRNFKFYSEWIVKMLRPALAVDRRVPRSWVWSCRNSGARATTVRPTCFWRGPWHRSPFPSGRIRYDERYVFYAIPALIDVGLYWCSTRFLEVQAPSNMAQSVSPRQRVFVFRD